jgi:hypothetical protein
VVYRVDGKVAAELTVGRDHQSLEDRGGAGAPGRRRGGFASSGGYFGSRLIQSTTVAKVPSMLLCPRPENSA